MGSPASVPPETSLTPPSSIPIKVSSNFTTNENKGLSITRSHEVAGKSSTDGPSSTAGKTGSFSIDALAKAKKALQMQKELSEKLKKIPQVIWAFYCNCTCYSECINHCAFGFGCAVE